MIQDDDYDDPFCLPNGVLINTLGLTTTRELNEAESAFSALAMQAILELPNPSEFSVESLKQLHYDLFSDVYPWAGQFRRIDMQKGDTIFESEASIGIRLEDLFTGLQDDKFLTDLPLDGFSEKLADFTVEINRIHPFREGNGRTQRLLLMQVSLNAGYELSWDAISPERMKDACISGINGDSSGMRKLLRLNLDKSPVPIKKSKLGIL